MDWKQIFGQELPVRHWWAQIKRNGLVLLKWILFALLIGVTVGAVGSAFHHAVNWATTIRGGQSWLLYLMPVAGLVIVASYHITGMSDDQGTEFVISSVRDAKPLRIRTAPLIFLGTVLTHLTGGSAGREGAALQLGGSISSWLGKVMKLDSKDERIITMAGMAAGFSALFGTPLAAAVFAMELVSVGVMYYGAIVPCMLSSLVAFWVAGQLGVEPTSFVVTDIPTLSGFLPGLCSLGRGVMMGVLCALVSVLFCFGMHNIPKVCYGKIRNPWIKAVVGGLVVVVLSLLLGRDYNGAGMNIITQALAGNAVWCAFLLKILFTGLTLGAGFKGGEIVPAFFVGSTFGCVAAPLLGLPASFGAAVGMVAVFCGVTNCPLTSMLLTYELFGGQGMPLMGLVIAVSYMLSGYWSLYRAQKIVYSKTTVEFVDRKTH